MQKAVCNEWNKRKETGILILSLGFLFFFNFFLNGFYVVGFFLIYILRSALGFLFFLFFKLKVSFTDDLKLF